MNDLESLRDLYKNSRQSQSDVKLGMNGATWRHRQFTTGDIIFKKEKNIEKSNAIINEIDQKYGLNTLTGSSLNKKNRWNLARDIYLHMNDYNIEQLDVRLFESRYINKKESPDCLKFYHSKADADDSMRSINSNLIKSGKGNLKSIQRQLILNEKYRRQEEEEGQQQQLNNNKRSKNPKNEELLDESEYVEYNIEYSSKPARRSNKKASKYQDKRIDERKMGPRNSARNFNYKNIIHEYL
jgi:hypothetical protein